MKLIPISYNLAALILRTDLGRNIAIVIQYAYHRKKIGFKMCSNLSFF